MTSLLLACSIEFNHPFVIIVLQSVISSNDNILFSRLVNSDPCCCSLTSEPLADQSYCGIIQVPYLLECAEDMGIWV